MRKVRGFSAQGSEMNFPPAGWLFHMGNVILELNPVGRKSVRHGSSFQTSAVLRGWPRKRWGWGGGRALFTWPVGRRFCPSPRDSLMERRKGAQLMIVTTSCVPLARHHPLWSSVDTFVSWEGSHRALQEWFHNSVMGSQC